MRIAYLGPEKTFTETLTRQIFPDAELVPMIPIRRVVMAVERGNVDLGVIPLENIYNGHVIHTLDSLTRCENVRIVQERKMKVVHCLGALPNHGKITRIHSKDQALEQCDQYIFENFPDAELVLASSTSEAAAYIAQSGYLDSAAIASEAALKQSGLEIMAVDICPNNFTRFIVLGRNLTPKTGDDKTIVAIHPIKRDQPGVLADITDIFRSQHINLEYVHSRPDRDNGYYFYVELDGHENDENVRNSIVAIRYSLDARHKHPDTLKVLGSFPNSHWKDEN